MSAKAASAPASVLVSVMRSVESDLSALNGLGSGRCVEECEPGRSVGGGGASWTRREREMRRPAAFAWKRVSESGVPS